MAALSAVDSNQSVVEAGNSESVLLGSSWYFNRKELEDNSPSRRDGIDLKKEAYLRKSYCTFLQELGMKLKVPQVTIATAIIFCHRFFLHQSHAKNDRRTVATICMFLAGKVEETPRPLKDVTIVSYEIIHKKDPAAAQRIKQKDVYEQQKELILLGERVVLVTIGFDFNVHHPYKPLVEAIKKFKVAQNALAQVAWNFVNDGLRTSLCLQFKPHHIAAGAIFLAAKFLKVKLPSDGEKVWWQEFDITPRQLEEVSNQMLELYEQNQGTPTSAGSVPEANSASVSNHRIPSKAQPSVEESAVKRVHDQATRSSSAKYSNTLCSSQFASDQSLLQMDKLSGVSSIVQHENSDPLVFEPKCTNLNQSEDSGKHGWHHESGNAVETKSGRASHGFDQHTEITARIGNVGGGEPKESDTVRNDIPKGYAHMDALKKIDREKVKAALEKRRKFRNDNSRKDLTHDDDLIERELESGVELAVENRKIRLKDQINWSKLTSAHEAIHANHAPDYTKHRTASAAETAEEGELSFDNCDFQSLEPVSQKRKIAVHIKAVEEKVDDVSQPWTSYSNPLDVLENGAVIGQS